MKKGGILNFRQKALDLLFHKPKELFYGIAYTIYNLEKDYKFAILVCYWPHLGHEQARKKHFSKTYQTEECLEFIWDVSFKGIQVLGGGDLNRRIGLLQATNWDEDLDNFYFYNTSNHNNSETTYYPQIL